MSWDLVEVLKWIRHEESNCVNNGIKHCFLCDTQPGVRKKITGYIRGSGYLGIMFNLIISRLLIGDYSLKSSAWGRTHFSPLRTLLLHPILPLQGLSMSWRGIWKFADSKAFLRAVCSAFRPTLILCPPAENWLLEKAGSPCAELSKLSVKELLPFLMPQTGLCGRREIFFTATGRRGEGSTSEMAFALNLFQNYFTRFLRQDLNFIWVLKFTHDTLQTWNSFTVH